LEKWEEIRKLYFNDRMKLRQISRTLGVHRDTVKRAILSSGGPRYERTVPYSSILEPFKGEIRQIIEETNGDILATVIYEKLSHREETVVTPRYNGSYSTLWRYVKGVKEQLKPKEAFLRIETPPGFDAQCDWGKVPLVINGESIRLSMFVLTLSYSRFKFARLFTFERQECFFPGHVEAFDYFGGVPKQVTYDNLTTAVAKILKGRNRQEQEAFVRFRGEFPFSSNFAAKRKANEKGKVENQIGYIRSHAFALDKEFDRIEDANAYLLGWLDKDAKRVHGTHKEVILARFEREKPSLNPLPSAMPECCRIAHAKVNKFSFVQFDTNRYSVPTEYVYCDVIVKGFERRIVIIKDEKVIAEHERLKGRYGEAINPYHFLSLLEQKSRAVDHAVVMESFSLDPIFYQLKDMLSQVVENPNREWIRVLRLTESYEMPKVTEAIRRALAYGSYDYASIKNLLLQQVHPKVIVSELDCLTEHPELSDVVVSKQLLDCYDVLLTGGGGPINE
jgi:transposase